MDKSLKRLKDLVRRSPNYAEYEARVLRFRKWYLEGLQTWTKATLHNYYIQNGGK